LEMDLNLDLEHKARAMLQKNQRMKNAMNTDTNAQAVAVWRWALRGIVIHNQ
jgi:hypothetical protein